MSLSTALSGQDTVDYEQRLRAYHAVGDAYKKMTHKLALKRLEDECAKWSF